MADILLSTLNARYIHAAFGLRYLQANLPEALQNRARVREFDVQQRPMDIVENLLSEQPRIIGFGVYIWNATATHEVVALLRKAAPEIVIVLGGPEVSYEWESQPLVALADFVITGEADVAFGELCLDVLDRRPPAGKILSPPLPDLAKLRLPYTLYSDEDLAHRVVYVEASRGCPFTCEFCLSSIDLPVRAFPLESFLDEMDRLLARGLLQLKFVDRTFNLHLPTSRRILEYFLDRQRPGLFLHFEMVPDRLPDALRDVIRKFPPGSLQFEVGVQTFNPEVATRIRRKQNLSKLEDNLQFLRRETGVHVHADLIAGLPGETMESFAEGFNRLVALRPQEIQVGILKRLRGTPISRHDQEFAMAYSPLPPYEILRTRDLTFAQVRQLSRFSRYWDLMANSGNFAEALPCLWKGGLSPFAGFTEWSNWLHQRLGARHGIALATLFEALHTFLVDFRQFESAAAGEILARDYLRPGRKDPPEFLRPWLPQSAPSHTSATTRLLPRRQARHTAGAKVS
ncbi:MAG: B12-binding domain-containing radical SAM protein [Verrucomicrobia bacterium]|nr:B12-binding domain-containing radical SAM protein [Verrucomicrobiota bacterium]